MDSKKYALLGNFTEDIILKDFDVFNNYTTLKRKEIINQKLYEGVITTKETNYNTFFNNHSTLIKNIQDYDLSYNHVYVKHFSHNADWRECIVDLTTVFCSSWALPFVVSPLCDYSFLRKHRMKIFKIKSNV